MRIPTASEFFIAGIEQPELTSHELNFLKSHKLGGVILFSRNVCDLPQVVALNASIIDANQTHAPLLSVDQEGGRVARLRGICTDIPAMADLNSVFEDDPQLVYRMGAMQGRELAALGFNLNFSPVCDLMHNDKTHVIGDRAFSETQVIAASRASLYIKGLQGAGVAACAKHFPGHGATLIDSHLALPVLETDIKTLWSRELVPFRAAIEADVATIMTAHIVTKSLDTLPATLSEKTLAHVLRRELAFHNVIISDDLDMKAVADHYSLRDILEHSLLASVDLFIIGNNFAKTKEAIAILQEMIDRHDIFKKKACEAALRIDLLRNRYIGQPKAPNLSEALQLVRSKPHVDLIKNLPRFS